MPRRSQASLLARQQPGPALTGILPNTATIAAAGAVGRTVATLSASGGSPPYVFSVADSGGLSLAVNGNLLVTALNPVGTAGAKTVQIRAVDRLYMSLTEPITVTVT